MRLINQKVNYDLSGGDNTFEAVQTESRSMAAHLDYNLTAEAEAEIEMSLDGVNYVTYPGTKQVLSVNETLHVILIPETVPGLYKRVKVTAGTGQGTINEIKYLI